MWSTKKIVQKNCQTPIKIIPQQRWIQSMSFGEEIYCKSYNCWTRYLKTNVFKDDYFKKEKTPFVPEKQLPLIIKGARKLSTKSLVDKILVIDEEQYFNLSNSEISGNDGYYTDNKRNKSRCCNI